MPKEGEDALESLPAIRELVLLLNQGAHVVVSMPKSGENKVVAIQRTSDGKLEVEYEV